MMRKVLLLISAITMVLLLNHQPAHAQFLKKLADKVSGNKGENQQGNVAKEDVQPIPENYTLSVTGSGPGLHLQYRMNMDLSGAGNGNLGNVNMGMDLYSAPGKGKARSEVNMKIPVVGERSMGTLTDLDHPRQITIINVRKKEYAILDFNDVEEGDQETFTVEKLGEETVHGLKCIHGKAVGSEGAVFEFWTTQQIPGYSELLKIYGRSGKMGSDNLWKAMKQSGTAGFLVKILVPNPNGKVALELTQIEKMTIPEKMLEIPPGFKKSNRKKWVKNYMKGRK